MKIIRGMQGIPEPIAATIGNFDGVHLGHQELLSRLIVQAKLRGLPTAVMIFEPQPNEFFCPEQAPSRISNLRDKVERLKECGVDYIICIRFNKAIASIKAESFARTILFERLNIRYLLVGNDFRFGHKRQGEVALLESIAADFGGEVHTCEDIGIRGQRVSSTLIRTLLSASSFKDAERFLGRPYSMMGRVLHGAQRGRQWGIPTANIAVHPFQTAIRGVYFVTLSRKNGHNLKAVANVGVRPTVDGKKAFLEVHILNFNQDLYGEVVRVAFLAKHRDEIKFSSVETLIEQIRCDIQSCYQYFNLPVSIDT